MIDVTGDSLATSVKDQTVAIKNIKTDETFTIDLNSPVASKQLQPGAYFVLTTPSGLRTETTNFTIRSGEREVVEVWWEPKHGRDESDGIDVGALAAPAAKGTALESAVREAGEWIFSKGGFMIIRTDGIYHEGIQSLEELPGGEFESVWVRFKDSKVLTDDDLKEYARFPSLGYPGLQGTGITGEGLVYLRELNNVEMVDLGSCTNLDPSALRHIEGFNELLILNLPPQCGDESMQRLQHWPNLIDLNLGNNVTGAGLKELTACPKLEQVVLAGCLKIKPEELRPLAQLPKLESLDLDVRHLTPGFMAVLADIPQLRKLHFDGDDEELDLSPLVQLHQLTQLSLPWMHRDDDDLIHLEKMTNLKWINLSHTAVTADGVDKLHQALPNCEIIWDGGMINLDAEDESLAPPTVESLEKE